MLFKDEIFPAKLQNKLGQKNFTLNFSGLTAPAKSFFLVNLAQKIKKTLFLVTSHSTEVHRIFSEANFLKEKFGPEGEIKIFPGFEALPVISKNYDARSVSFSYEIMQRLTKKTAEPVLILASLKNILSKFYLGQKSQAFVLELKTDQQFEFEILLKKLVDFGYEKTALVEEAGQFSQRGGLIDVFPGQLENPVRLEFSGDQIVSLRIFDVRSQKSLKKINFLEIFPASPFSSGRATPASAVGRASSIFNLLSEDEVLVFDEPGQIKQTFELILKEQGRFAKNFWAGNWPEFEASATGRQKLINFYQFLPASEGEKDSWNFEVSKITEFNGRIEEIKETLGFWLKNGRKILIVTRLKERVKEILKDLAGDKNLLILPGSLSLGFVWEPLSLYVLTDKELFGISYDLKKPYFASGRPGVGAEQKVDLKTNDYLVHLRYGIGQYQGLKKIKIGGVENEYLFISYAGSDKLFVPTDQLELVQKYTGFSRPPRLTRLAGEEWSKVIKVARNFTGQLAFRLYGLYQKRQRMMGFAFGPDSNWQKELEEAFPYQATAHQLAAIEDVKKDLEKPKPMERLIIGDVGYGKTEVAIRAAFKAAVAGKQVALLAPTTILVEQHYQNFLNRLSPFPIKIAMLSRFQSKAEIKKIIQEIARGQVDIVIGTHRLITPDVHFKDLGLLIIDEEQRFGVVQKEKIKNLKGEIDVLLLSATPIPRTFSLAISGIFDMSLMATPPEDRLPIKTMVGAFNRELIREAIIFELEREGQVFFVHNRIQTIYQMKEMLGRLLPGVKITLVHGRLKETEIEKGMTEFKKGESQILLATAIIENGLDLPNVNTLIVDHAQKFGLAELYQLRGRVGRSDRQAFAYFLYEPAELKTQAGRERLQAIKDFSNLGDGYKIAQKDLEIRGAGTFFGARQHGHIARVGFEFYCQMLEDSVKEVRGETLEEKIEPELKLGVAAFLPKDFINEETVRLAQYQRLLKVKTGAELRAIAEELVDRFGRLPGVAQNLLLVLEIKFLAKTLKLQSIARKKNQVIISVANLSFRQVRELGQNLGQLGQGFIKTEENFIVALKFKEEAEFLENLKKLLEKLAG